MVKNRISRLDSAMQEEMLGNAGAVYKEILRRLDSRLDSCVKGLEATAGVQSGKVLEKELSSFRSEMASTLDSFRKELLQSVAAEVERIVGQEREDRRLDLSRIKDIVGAIVPPSISVQVPEQKLPEVRIENTVQVPEQKQLAPIVNVNVPEQKAAEVRVENIVNVPEQKSIINVPGQPAPVVNVQVPTPRYMKKQIDYDEFGRPRTISEMPSSD